MNRDGLIYGHGENIKTLTLFSCFSSPASPKEGGEGERGERGRGREEKDEIKNKQTSDSFPVSFFNTGEKREDGVEQGG